MTPEEKQEWERTRAEGYDRHILSTIVREGVPEGIIGTFLAISFRYLEHRPAQDLREILAGLGLIILGMGYIRGDMSWRERENEYVKVDASCAEHN